MDLYRVFCKLQEAMRIKLGRVFCKLQEAMRIKLDQASQAVGTPTSDCSVLFKQLGEQKYVCVCECVCVSSVLFKQLGEQKYVCVCVCV